MTAFFFFFSVDSHLYTIGALQILAYEDLLQSREVSTIITIQKGQELRK